MKTESARTEAFWLLRIGAVCAIAGAAGAGVGNVLHPVTPRDDELGTAHVIAHSDHWTLLHLVIIAGTILMPVGLIAIQRSIGPDGLARALTRLGVYAVTIGATLGVVTVILDGVGAKQLADQWAASPDATKDVALGLVSANETINFALAGMFNASFAGVPFVLFGLAIVRSGTYPGWLGWIALAAGIGSVAAGTVQAFAGRPTTATLILTIIGPTVIALWMLVIGVLLWRRSNQEPDSLPLQER